MLTQCTIEQAQLQVKMRCVRKAKGVSINADAVYDRTSTAAGKDVMCEESKRCLDQC